MSLKSHNKHIIVHHIFSLNFQYLSASISFSLFNKQLDWIENKKKKMVMESKIATMQY